MQAVCALAVFAVEVDVAVVVLVMVVAGADFVAQGTAAVLDVVDKMVLEQECEGTEDGAAFGSRHSVLEFAKRQRTTGLLQFFVHQ